MNQIFPLRRYKHLRLRLVDIIALGYMGLIGLAFPFFHHHIPNWPRDFMTHAAFVIFGLEIVRLAEKHPHRKILWFVRIFYPLTIIYYGYFEMNHTNRMFAGSYWVMDLLVHADKVIFGVHPTVWVQRFYTPWLDELMNICYVSYYSFLPLATLPLFLRGKREQALAAFSIATLSYSANFILFYAFPSLCPRMIPGLEEMRTADYTGYLVASMTQYFQSKGAISGGCFPSTHVSGAMAWALVTWRYNHKLSYLLLPMALGVAVATVYLGYHHAVDPLVGIILAIVAYFVGVILLQRRREDPNTSY